MSNGAFDELDRAIANTEKLIGNLNYACYRHNREISPDIPPHDWGNVFKNWEELEARYQLEMEAERDFQWKHRD